MSCKNTADKIHYALYLNLHTLKI